MLTILEGTASELRAVTEAELAAYRYEVFVQSLGWKLPCDPGIERDQFDRNDTVYVVAKESDGSIGGCARLLPTTKPYLLAEVFPQLLGQTPPPSDTSVWELSRFSTQSRSGVPFGRDEMRRRFCTLFAAVVEAATERGATRLITFTALGVERILRSIGMHAHRLGPPQLVDSEPVLAMWIELDDQTRASLGLPAIESNERIH